MDTILQRGVEACLILMHEIWQLGVQWLGACKHGFLTGGGSIFVMQFIVPSILVIWAGLLQLVGEGLVLHRIFKDHCNRNLFVDFYVCALWKTFYVS